MKGLMIWATGILLAVGVAGCGTTYSGNPAPCASCTYKVERKGRSEDRKWVCVVDGKEVNCAANTPECPGCRK